MPVHGRGTRGGPSTRRWHRRTAHASGMRTTHTSSVEVLVLPVRVGAGVLDEVLASQTTQACPCTNIQA